LGVTTRTVRLLFLFVLLLRFVKPAPVDAAFAARKVVTIDSTRVPGTANHSNFPVLVSLTALNLRSTANGGLVTSSQGHDILFRDEDPTTCSGPAACRLDHEIESYDPVTGTLVAWVRVPTLRYSGSGANTVIYLYFGDATVTCSQQNKAGGGTRATARCSTSARPATTTIRP
jgi:hypothetical protein